MNRAISKAVALRPWREWLAGLPNGVPVCLHDFTPAKAGSGIPLNVDKLSAPFNRPMLVDGIHFRLDLGIASTFMSSTDGALSMLARVAVGPFALSDDFVNVAALGSREQYLQGESISTNGAGALSVANANAIPDGCAAHYTWRFDEPLFVPNGLPVRIFVRRQVDGRDDFIYATGTVANSGSVSGANFGATVFGRYFTDDVKLPSGMHIPVPYAGVFADTTIPSSTVFSSGAVTQIAGTELALVNRSSGVVYVDRLIGRLPTRDEASGNAIVGDYSGPEPTVRIVRTYATRSANGQRGAFALTSNRPMVDPAKPFNAVFDLQTRSLDTSGMILPPGDGLMVTVLKKTATAGLFTQVRVHPIIGLVGSRLERWS